MMNKTNYLLLPALFFIALCQAAPTETWQSLEQLILRVHVVVFSKENLFNKQMTPSETTQWNAMLDEVRKDTNKLAHGDAKILAAMKFATNLGYDILNKAKLIYATVFSKGTAPSASAVRQANIMLDELSKKASELRKHEVAMNNSTYWRNSTDKKEARRNLAEVLFLALESSILKLNNDFRKHPLVVKQTSAKSATE